MNCQHIRGLSDEEATKLNLPTGIPFIFEFNRETMEPVDKNMRFLADDETVKKAVDKVANISAKK